MGSFVPPFPFAYVSGENSFKRRADTQGRGTNTKGEVTDTQRWAGEETKGKISIKKMQSSNSKFIVSNLR